MAGRLMTDNLLRQCGRAASALALCLPLPLHAQLADPTRPPILTAPDAAAPGTPGTPGAAVASGLQSIILGKDGKSRPAALINGQLVQLGEMVGEARLAQVAEDHVILLGPEGREVLRLTPAAEKIEKVGAGKTAKPVGMNAVKGEMKK